MLGCIVSASCLLPSRRIGTDSSSIFTFCQKMDALWFTEVLLLYWLNQWELGGLLESFPGFLLPRSVSQLRATAKLPSRVCCALYRASAGGWPILLKTRESLILLKTVMFLCLPLNCNVFHCSQSLQALSSPGNMSCQHVSTASSPSHWHRTRACGSPRTEWPGARWDRVTWEDGAGAPLPCSQSSQMMVIIIKSSCNDLRKGQVEGRDIFCHENGKCN